MATAEKLESRDESDVPVPKPSVKVKNDQSYNLLGQMMGGVQGPSAMKKPKPRKAR